MKIGELLIHEGRLAQYRGSWVNQERPEVAQRIAVSTIRDGKFPEYILGQAPWIASGTSWSGTVWGSGQRDVFVQADDWDLIEIVTPVRPPRAGREYGWKWIGTHSEFPADGWVRAWYSYCPVCGERHNPDFTTALCGRCHRGGKCLASCCPYAS